MTINRELSQFGNFITVDENGNRNVGIATTVRISGGGLYVGDVEVISPTGVWRGSNSGLIGAQGAQGAQGPAGGGGGGSGAQGAEGAQGAQGAQGSAGTTGAQGSTGDSYWASTSVGIHTLSSVGIGTTNPTSTLTVKGGTFLESLYASSSSIFTDIRNIGITTTKDLIVNGTGNGSGSISTMALMSRTNYLDFGPAIPNTTAPQSFALRMGSDRVTGTLGPYKILEAVYYGYLSGGVFLNNWQGNEAIVVGDNEIIAGRYIPVFVGGISSTGTSGQKLQVTGGAYVSDNVGLGTTNPTSKLHVVGNTLITGVSTTATLNVGTAGTIITTTSDGSVGIGTNVVNSAYKLVVKGSTYFEGTTTSAGSLRIADSTGAYGGTISGSFTTPLDITHYSDNPEIRFRTQVPLSGASTGLTINQTNATFNSHVITGNGLNITCGGFVSVASTFSVGTGGTVITTTSAGLVGINSTTPTQKLDVVGSVKVGINTSQGVILTSPNGTKYQLYVENDGTLKTVAV